MRHHPCSRVAGAVAMLACWTAADAVPIDFSISGANTSAWGVAPGTNISINPSTDLAHDFTLDLDGGTISHTFDFLDIGVSAPLGFGGAGGIIEATLNFSSPEVATTLGVFGGFAVILGLASIGEVVVLSNPDPISFGDGGLFGVTFSGFADICTFCSKVSGTVSATVSLLRAPATAVPEPGALLLLGAGLVAIGVSRRRRFD